MRWLCTYENVITFMRETCKEKKLISRENIDEKRIENESEKWYLITLLTFGVTSHQLTFSLSLFISGAYTGSAGQVETNWRRDLGENYRFRTKQACSESLCARPRFDSQRQRRWLRWNEVSEKNDK
jgi:hypothetical protein